MVTLLAGALKQDQICFTSSIKKKKNMITTIDVEQNFNIVTFFKGHANWVLCKSPKRIHPHGLVFIHSHQYACSTVQRNMVSHVIS